MVRFRRPSRFGTINDLTHAFAMQKFRQGLRARRPHGHEELRRKVRSVISRSAMEVEGAEKPKRHKTSGDDYPAMPNVWSNNIFAFPPNLVTRMRYCEVITFSTTSVLHQVWNMNSIFDPNATGTGHQPMYHDIFQSVYAHYTVLGSKITARYASTTDGFTARVGLAVGDNSTFSTNQDTLCEQNKNKWALLSKGIGGNNAITLSGTYGATTDEGIDPYAGSSLTRTAFGANPSELYCASTWVGSTDLVSTTTAVVQVEIEYTVLLSELLDQTQA